MTDTSQQHALPKLAYCMQRVKGARVCTVIYYPVTYMQWLTFSVHGGRPCQMETSYALWKWVRGRAAPPHLSWQLWRILGRAWTLCTLTCPRSWLPTAAGRTGANMRLHASSCWTLRQMSSNRFDQMIRVWAPVTASSQLICYVM